MVKVDLESFRNKIINGNGLGVRERIRILDSLSEIDTRAEELLRRVSRDIKHIPPGEILNERFEGNRNRIKAKVLKPRE